MALAGYARVSTKEQHLDVQLDRLWEAGCEEIFAEQMSGVHDKRPKLQECLTWLRKGDVLVITRLDRLARSMRDLCNIGDELSRKGVDLKVLDQHIDTTTSGGRLTFHMFGAIAQFETELRADRQREGIVKARERGVQMGRQRALSRELADQLRKDRAEGMTIKQICRIYGVSYKTAYNYLGLYASSSSDDMPIRKEMGVCTGKA